MTFTITPNMLLQEPTIGVSPGPEFAANINASLTLIDQHDHTAGKGAQITAASLNINSNLSMNNHFLISTAGVTLSPQSSVPINGTVYQDSTGFLRYVDLVSGTNIQITNSSGIASAGGAIAGLVAPASATYVPISSTFIWQADVNIPANLDAASVIIRNPGVANSKGVTLRAIGALASNYNITLPLPVAGGIQPKILQMDTSGNMTGGLAPDNSTIVYTSGTLALSVGIVPGSQLSGSITTATLPAANLTGGITGSQLTSGTVTGTQIQTNVDLNGQAVREQGRNLVVSGTNASTSLAIVRATFNAAGTLINGEGATCNAGGGNYTVTWNTPFSDNPVVVACSAVNSAGTGFACQVRTTGPSNCSIFTFETDNSGIAAIQFNVIAIGQRG